MNRKGTMANGPAPRAQPGRLLRLVVGGEIRSGKSTVINAMLRDNVIPQFRGDQNRPVMVVRHRETPGLLVHYQDGSLRPYRSFADCGSLDGARLCEIDVYAPHLAAFEIVELPFYHDGHVTEETFEAMSAADVFIWVTIASQAWRLSERAIVQRLPRALRARSVIVASRADKLTQSSDWDRISERLSIEAGEFFSGAIPICGARRLIAETAGSDEQWHASGGDVLTEALSGFARELLTAEAEEPAPAAAPGDDNVIAFRASGQPTAAEPEAEPEQPAAAKPVPETLSSLAASVYGVSTAGLCDFGALTVLAGEEETARIAASVSADCLRNRRGNYQLIGETENSSEVQVRMAGHFLLCRRAGHDGAFVFLLCDEDHINPALARTAIRRMCQIYETGLI